MKKYSLSNQDPNYCCYTGNVIDISFSVSENFTYNCSVYINTQYSNILFNSNQYDDEILRLKFNTPLYNYFIKNTLYQQSKQNTQDFTTLQSRVSNTAKLSNINTGINTCLGVILSIPPINYVPFRDQQPRYVDPTMDIYQNLLYGGIRLNVNGQILQYINFLPLIQDIILNSLHVMVNDVQVKYYLDMSSLRDLPQCISTNIQQVIIS